MINGPDILRRLKRVAPLSKASPRVVRELLGAAEIRYLGSGSLLFKEGGAPTAIYILLQGAACWMTTDSQYREYVIDFIPLERPFSIPAVIEGRPYPATGRVLKESVIVDIPAPLFRRCVEADARLSSAVMRDLSDIALSHVSQIKALKTKTAPERLAAFLCTLANSTDGTSCVSLPCEKRMLAGWLGITPSSLSRVFRQLERCGVRSYGSQLLIESLDELRAFAGLSS